MIFQSSSLGGLTPDQITAITTGVPALTAALNAVGAGGSITDALNVAGTQIRLSEQQQSFLSLNEQLLQSGQAPITWGQYQANAAPAGDSTGLLLLLGGVALLLFAGRGRGGSAAPAAPHAVPRFRHRRRR